jgi:cell division protein FtsI (penicillin-binding protein 3)
MSNKRAVILSTAVIFGFLMVGVRLGVLMLLDHDSLAAKARHQHQIIKDLNVNRGLILDRRGRALALNVDAYSVYGRPREVLRPRAVSAVLSEVTGRNFGSIHSTLRSNRNFVWIKRKLSLDGAEKLKAMELEGVGFISEAKRYYPKGTLASHLLGFVGVDNQPLEGVELAYDDYLKGEKRKVLVTKDAGGRTLSEGLDMQSRGNGLVLTIDEGLQYIAERSLENAMRRWDPAAAIAVMMNPYDGEILAMASRPSYDLNEPGSARPSNRRNRAITDPYEPGSTFKVVTAAAALEEGVVRPGTVFDVSDGYIDVGPMRVYDSHKQGKIIFTDVIKTSSNVGTIQVGSLLESATFHSYIGKFGFGARTGVDLPGEAPGIVRNVSRWSATSHAAVSIGYEVAVTPLQILRAYSTVANGGWLVTPHVVKEIVAPDGSVLKRFDPGLGEKVISTRTANTLKDILISVTQEGGTAREASVNGNLVAGKTGTTRLIDRETGTYSHERYVSSFVGFVPADNPRIALVVVVFEPKEQYYGGRVAAPVFREIASGALAYLNVPRDDVPERNVLLVENREF